MIILAPISTRDLKMRRGRKRVQNPETARRILAAAENHFAAEGLAGARTDEIAAAAHANKAMLYYYFGDKRRLHRAVLENLLRQLRLLSDEFAHSKASPHRNLENLLLGYMDFLASHPNYPRLIQRQAMESSHGFDWIFREFLSPFQNTLNKIIEAGAKQREFRHVDARHAVFSILGMTTFYFVAARRYPQFFDGDAIAPKALEERKKAMLDLLMHGLLQPQKRQPEARRLQGKKR
jgi:TetR/AcrR family transcriptional regulator